MFYLLIRLMLLAALAELRISVWQFENCYGRTCIQRIEKATRQILRMNWRPISVFPEEAKRFR